MTCSNSAEGKIGKETSTESLPFADRFLSDLEVDCGLEDCNDKNPALCDDFDGVRYSRALISSDELLLAFLVINFCVAAREHDRVLRLLN